ncbi:hypothetical protein AK830_g8711 [Neonectria ditissima]|uniref:Peroxin 20 n=1 Tax=Neonectria ditissima TaxID=78410 RepID=A0A0P7BBR2_9HYPO|nr:hypothetical protein AK830_g8711 [Neonectria ditissima]
MADASCSGGTPFKRLIEHQSRDVSHHQDRLVDRAGQAHGAFRSAPQARQGADVFNSFMEGPSALPNMPQHHAAGRLSAHAAALEPVHQAPGFAPSQAQQFRAPAADVSNWAADFGRFSQQRPQQVPNHQMPMARQMPMAHQMPMGQNMPQLAYQAPFAQPSLGYAPLYGPTNGGLVDPNAASAQRPAAEAEFDEEMDRWMAVHGPNAGATENADIVMEQIAHEMELNEAAFKQAEIDYGLTDAAAVDQQASNMADLSLESPTAMVPEQAEALKPKSEVSEAAGRLLESVEHEDGDKWKNSRFLSLMRDFRDGNKDIVDNEIRETPEAEAESTNATQ